MAPARTGRILSGVLSNLSSLLPVGGIALLVGAWSQIRALVARFRSLFVTKVTFVGYVSRAVTRHCHLTCKRSPFGDRFYEGQQVFVRPLQKVQLVPYERPSAQAWVFWRGWIPFTLGGKLGSKDATLPEESVSEMTFLRGTLDIDKFVLAAVDSYNDSRSGQGKYAQNRFRVRRIIGRGGSKARMSGEDSKSAEVSTPAGNGSAAEFPVGSERLLNWKVDDIGQPCPENPLNHIVVPEALKDAVNEFNRWLASKSWFQDRDIPWRRGWQLKGKPGTGKSLLARTLAQVGNMPIFVFDLATLSNEEFWQGWQEMLECAPCMALFEDFDTVFEGRENKLGEMGGGLTFDCVLNAISGVERADGVFIILTTNHEEAIDPALGVATEGSLSTRPGRLDRIVEVPAFDEAARRALISKILRDWPEVIEEKVVASDGFTAAQVTDLCVRYALVRFWGTPETVKEARPTESQQKPPTWHRLVDAADGRQDSVAFLNGYGRDPAAFNHQINSGRVSLDDVLTGRARHGST